MKRLDRYVARCFLSALVICGVSIVLVYVLMDFFGHLNQFLKSEDEGGFWTRIGEHYAVLLPVIVYRLAPAITLMAALFTVSRLERANEITPVKAAGVSVFRLLAAVFVLAGLCSAGLAAAQEYVIPALFDRFQGRLRAGGAGEVERNVFRRDRAGVFVQIGQYDPALRRVEGVLLRFPPGPDGRGREVSAAFGHFEPGRRGRGRWLLCDGYLQALDARGAPLRQPSGKLELQRFNGPEQPFEFATDLAPLDLEGAGRERFYLRFEHLSRQYRRTQAVGLKTQLHQRGAYPLMNMVILLIGLPFVLRVDTGGSVFMSVAICLVVSLLFFAAQFVCSHLAQVGWLHPVSAAWLPDAFFASVGVALMDRVDT